MRFLQLLPLVAVLWLGCDAAPSPSPVATQPGPIAPEAAEPAAATRGPGPAPQVQVGVLPEQGVELNPTPMRWKQARLSAPTKIATDYLRVQTLAGGHALLSGERSYLLAPDGEVLGEYDGHVSLPHNGAVELARWGFLGEEAIVDLRTGARHEVEVTNRDVAQRKDQRETLVASGDAVWWVSHGYGRGPTDAWIARVDPDKPSTAQLVSFPAQPAWYTIGFVPEKNWLVVANQQHDHNEENPDCPMMVFDGADVRCLPTRPTHNWVVHSGQFMGLMNHDDRVVDLLNTREVVFSTPSCRPYLFGYETQSGNIFLWCKDSRQFGIRTPDNQLLLTETTGGDWSISTPRGATPRFFAYGKKMLRGDAKSMPQTLIVDMHGGVFRLDQRVLAVGETHAVVELEGGRGLVDLVGRTVEPLDTLECEEGQRLAITHSSGDRFITSCLEFDRASVEGKEFGCGNAALRARRHTVRAQEVLDVKRATRFVVTNAVVEATLPSALIARAGGDLYIEDGGSDTVVFTMD